MLDACFLHLYFCQRLPTLQHGLSAIADLLVFMAEVKSRNSTKNKDRMSLVVTKTTDHSTAMD